LGQVTLMAKPQFGNKQKVTGGALKRARRRLAAVRLDNPRALPNVSPKGGYTGREARKLKRAAGALPKSPRGAKGPAPFNPLAPVTGKTFDEELAAKVGLQFGSQDRELARNIANQDQTTANTGSYYDDYRQALRESTARINETNRVAAETSEARVDNAYGQDKAAVAARDAQASEAAAKLGRPAMQSQEGSQAVEAARSQGNQSAARVRGQGAADTALMEKRQANSVLAKSEALARENARRRRLGEDAVELAQKKGDFKVAERDKTRQSEREWAAIQKEFKLERRGQDLDAGATRQQQKTERMKANAQKTIARLYSSANKASARAQIRVARLQLKKGEIDQHQFNTITNIYKGLPGGGGSGSNGSGKGGQLLPWERDKVSNAVNILDRNNAKPQGKSAWIARMQKEGVPLRLARVAWKRYADKHLNTGPGNTGGGHPSTGAN
jgi:hypothetical protein